MKQREKLKRTEAELYAYRQAFNEIYWMARRYATGRDTYAPWAYDDALKRVMKFGFEPQPDDGQIWATKATQESLLKSDKE